VTDLYPSFARDEGLEGGATIDCGVSDDGRLDDCMVVEEHPSKRGFGSATIRLASHFRLRTTTRSGEPVGGRRIRVPVLWRLER
jgi:TonB family protein